MSRTPWHHCLETLSVASLPAEWATQDLYQVAAHRTPIYIVLMQWRNLILWRPKHQYHKHTILKLYLDSEHPFSICLNGNHLSSTPPLVIIPCDLLNSLVHSEAKEWDCCANYVFSHHDLCSEIRFSHKILIMICTVRSCSHNFRSLLIHICQFSEDVKWELGYNQPSWCW